MSLAATALAHTERLTVGIGILPAVARNPARRPRSLALAGRVADGVVLAEGAGPTVVRGAIEQAGAAGPFRVSVFTALAIAAALR